MNRLFLLYLRRFGTRDTILLTLFAGVIIVIYLYLHHQSRYPEGLGNIRHNAAICWVLWNAFYAFITVFSGYQSLRKSYEYMLLPASTNSKFILTMLRVFIVVPIISASVLLLLDYGCCHLFAVTSNVARKASSMFDVITYAGNVYHRLPIMPYYLIAFVAIILVLKTIRRHRLPMFVIPAFIVGFVIVSFGPHFEYGQYNYPFLAGKLTASCHGTTVTQLVSWTSMGARLQRIVSCVFLLALPASMVYLSYLRFKEMELER